MSGCLLDPFTVTKLQSALADERQKTELKDQENWRLSGEVEKLQRNCERLNGLSSANTKLISQVGSTPQS